jgi:phage protein D
MSYGMTLAASVSLSAFGQRKETLAHTIPLNSQEAQAAAESYFKMSARRFLTGRGVAETQAGLHVGSFVELQGLGPLFGGQYYLVYVVHLFDGKHGLRSEFRAERPGIGRT